MKEDVDILLKNALVLTMDPAMQRYEPGAVAIQGDSILAVGPDAEVLDRFRSSEVVDCQGKVIMPGLVNAHTHAPMTLLRGLADDRRLDVWLLGYMMPVEREFVSPDFVKLGTYLACVEFIRGGVTCFADMYYYEEDIAQAAADSGLRALCTQTVLKFPSPDAGSYEESLGAARQFIKKWKEHPLITPGVAPHSPYTCTAEILLATTELALEFDVPLHTHLAETAIEVKNSREEHGMPVIPYVKKLDLLNAKVLAAHCVHIDDGEMHTLLHHNTGVAHNPSSNMKLASGFAPVSRMLELGLNVGIGTDGAASNNDLDMFEEIRLASFIAKGATGDPTILPAETALLMATRLGAQALHMGDQIGSLEPGKRADLILVDIYPTHNAPRFRRDDRGLYAQLVYATKSTDVTDVMVDGRWLMRDRQLTTLDETPLLKEAEAYAQRIDSFLITREGSLLSKLVALAGATEAESFEVQIKARVQDPEQILMNLQKPEVIIVYHRHYHEYDTYFQFDDPQQGRLRYREDEFIDPLGQVKFVRYRLTMIGPTREHHFPSDVLLSRSRYLAEATHSLRFYREYFQPSDEIFIEKDRLRWKVIFRQTELFVNLDRIEDPDLGYFLEVKSRTWSRIDAEHKAQIAFELMNFLGASIEESVSQDYFEIVEVGTDNQAASADE